MKRLAPYLFALMLAAIGLGAAAPAVGPTAGPVWWRISNGGDSTLWILGMPDGLPMDTAWNDASLGQRLSSARLLISPLLGKAVSDPDPYWTFGAVPKPLSQSDPDPSPAAFGYAVSTTPFAAASQTVPISLIWYRTLGAPADARTFKDPAARRLSPEMIQRLQADMPPALGDNKTTMANAKTWELAVWMDLWNWPRGKLLGNPVTGRAQDLATNAHLPIDLVYVSALWKPILLDSQPMAAGKEMWADFDWIYNIAPNIRIVPPEEVQQHCLAEVLSQAESKKMPAQRLAAVQAWARGDVEHALKRSNSVQLCLMGDQPSTNAAAFERSQALTYIQSLDHAFEAPGQTVALVEFDPLLLEKGGVLDHYRRLGYDITMSNGME